MKILIVVIAGLLASVPSFASQDCRIGLKDSLNKFSTVVSVEGSEDGVEQTFTVIDHSLHNTVRLRFVSDSMVSVDAGVPKMKLSEIEKKYSGVTSALMKNKTINEDGQLTWEPLEIEGCTASGVSLIQFLVFEWFYFG